MKTEFSNRMKDVFNYVREEVIRLGDKNIGVEHLFLGIIREGEGTAMRVLTTLEVNTRELRKSIESKIINKENIKSIEKNTIEFKKQAERILKKSIMEQKSLNEEEIKTIHVLLAILLDSKNIVSSAFEDIHISYEVVFDEYEKQSESIFSSNLDDDEEEDENDDVFGHTVNIAARLEAISSSNELTVSESVYQSLEKNWKNSFKDQGPVMLKNIQHPVHVWATSDINQTSSAMSSTDDDPKAKLVISPIQIDSSISALQPMGERLCNSIFEVLSGKEWTQTQIDQNPRKVDYAVKMRADPVSGKIQFSFNLTAPNGNII
jgi:hypothetical protein